MEHSLDSIDVYLNIGVGSTAKVHRWKILQSRNANQWFPEVLMYLVCFMTQNCRKQSPSSSLVIMPRLGLYNAVYYSYRAVNEIPQ